MAGTNHFPSIVLAQSEPECRGLTFGGCDEPAELGLLWHRAIAVSGACTAAKTARWGSSSWHSPSASGQIAYLREGLAQFGYVEGRNIALEPFFTDGDNKSERRRAVRALIEEPVHTLLVAVFRLAELAKKGPERDDPDRNDCGRSAHDGTRTRAVGRNPRLEFDRTVACVFA